MFRYLNSIGWAVITSLFLVLVAPAYAEDINSPLPAPVGRVVWVKGIFKAVMANKEERILQKTSVIYEHDELLTDDSSQAQIVFTDNTLMTFRPGTKFYINHYEYSTKANKKTRSVGKYVMDLFQGGFRTITGLIAKNNPSDYRVNTPVATIGVRGTDYTVFLKGGEIYVGYYEGTPCVTGGAASDSSTDSTAASASDAKGKTLCLTSTTPYAYIPEGSSTPVPLSARPEVFQEKLEITPASISPFASVIEGGKVPTGPITNFCITQ